MGSFANSWTKVLNPAASRSVKTINSVVDICSLAARGKSPCRSKILFANSAKSLSETYGGRLERSVIAVFPSAPCLNLRWNMRSPSLSGIPPNASTSLCFDLSRTVLTWDFGTMNRPVPTASIGSLRAFFLKSSVFI